MLKKYRKYLTASVTVMAAAATAHLMQRGSGDTQQFVPVAPAQAASLAEIPSNRTTVQIPPPNPVTVMARPEMLRAKPVVDTAEPPEEVAFVAAAVEIGPKPEKNLPALPAMPRPPKDGVMPAPLRLLGPELQARMAVAVPSESEPASNPAQQEPKRSEFGLSCGALLTASPKDSAMVGLTLTDPCRGNETFTLRHGALTYSARMNQLGTYMADIPALSEIAVFTVGFEDGTETDTEVTVSLADKIDRVALFTGAKSGLGIHALEFGADYEQSGHIWAGNPRDPDGAAKAGGGFVTVLGDNSLPDAKRVEIYTFPLNTRHREGVVRLSIEAEITADNCGKDISGQTLQKVAGQASVPVALTLAMPDCDAIGEFLVLKNLLRDLKIASN